MNFQQIDQTRRQYELEHYKKSGRFRAYCCGCISGEKNSLIVCFCWAGISFYFAILAFMNKSPFYSYIDEVALVAFGTINLLFGIVTLCSMVIFLIRMNVMRMQGVGVFGVIDKSKRTVFAITANALGVLIITLVTFILFIIDKRSFNDWCIGSSADYVKDVYIDYHPNSTVTTLTSLNSTLTSTTDAYNCERLFQDEVKWSLLCMVVMYVVYIHWILIIAARTSYNFYRQPPMMPMVAGEFVNVAPSKKRKNKINVFNNIKPAKSFWKELLVHKQYGEFEHGSIERDLFQEQLNEKPVMDKRLSSNITLIDNDTAISPPMNAFLAQPDNNIPYH
ncbi:uncharacterized protein ATC70_010058 [Mucor velutinosus]|uniref:Uncharacterized protein n=1 Tax=Mucor velutinosus TaxID=708070 RepID=A0AAN7I3I1_9FUNG|nr:hypothetical protein ATC70_010058 [Mucor velutinosus]